MKTKTLWPFVSTEFILRTDFLADLGHDDKGPTLRILFRRLLHRALTKGSTGLKADSKPAKGFVSERSTFSMETYDRLISLPIEPEGPEFLQLTKLNCQR